MPPHSEPDGEPAGAPIVDAEAQFRSALVRSRLDRTSIGEVESAAAQYCREMRRQGFSPERVLKDAKEIIHSVLDGDDAPVAERAVLSCIQHYYRAD